MADVTKEVGWAVPSGITGKVTPTGYTPLNSQSMDLWDQDGEILIGIDHAMHWALGDWINAGETRWKEECWQALAISSKSIEWWQQVRRVAALVAPADRVRELPWSYHQAVAALDPELQRALLARALNEDWERETLRAEVALLKNGHPEIEQNNKPGLSYDDAKEGKEATTDTKKGKKLTELTKEAKKATAVRRRQERIDRQEQKRAENAARKKAKAKGEKVPPKAVATEPLVVLYDVLLVDPWRDEEATLADVVALPVADLFADDAVMFMWSSVERLPESMTLLEEWGFDYRSQLVWRKTKATITSWTREQHELVLIGKRGNTAKPVERDRPPSVFDAPAPRQGGRPDILLQIIERMLPKGKRVIVLPTGDLPRAHQDTWHIWNAEPKGKRRVA